MRLAGRLLVISASLGCAAAPTDSGAASLAIPRPAQLAGCYHVEVGAWAETGQHKGFVPFTEFQLDTMANSTTMISSEARRAGREVLRTAQPAITGRRPGPGVWYPIGQDSLFIEWYNGNISGGYRLAVQRDSVMGVATTWHHWRTLREGMRPEDVVDPMAPVRGKRVPCQG